MQGAEAALAALAKHFGDGLLTELPALWTAATAELPGLQGHTTQVLSSPCHLPCQLRRTAGRFLMCPVPCCCCCCATFLSCSCMPPNPASRMDMHNTPASLLLEALPIAAPWLRPLRAQLQPASGAGRCWLTCMPCAQGAVKALHVLALLAGSLHASLEPTLAAQAPQVAAGLNHSDAAVRFAAVQCAVALAQQRPAVLPPLLTCACLPFAGYDSA